MSDNQSSPSIRAPQPGMRADATSKRNRLRFWLVVIAAAIVLLVLAAVASAPYWRPFLSSHLPWASSPEETSVTQPETGPASTMPGTGPASATSETPATASSSTLPAPGSPSNATPLAVQKPPSAETAATEPQKPDDHPAANADAAARSQQTLAEDQRRLAVTVGEVAGRLDKLEAAIQRVGGQAHTDQILVLAAAQLQDALSRSAPFEPVLAVFQAVAGKDQQLAPELETLAPYAQAGVRSRIRLEQELRMLESTLDQPLTESHTSWWLETIDRAKRLISVHHAADPAHPETEPASADRSIALAEADLSKDDLPGAIDEMKGLQGDAATHGASWLKHAEARWDAEQAAAKIQTILTERLAGPDEASP